MPDKKKQITMPLPDIIDKNSFIQVNLKPRDYLYSLEYDFDIEAQIKAIYALLYRHRAADNELDSRISKLDKIARQTRGIQNNYAVEEWVEHVHSSVYQSAAHSMAAAGMLAPLYETIFHQTFQRIGSILFSNHSHLPPHTRWKNSDSLKWDCHYVFENGHPRRDISKGIIQLNEALDLQGKMPSDLSAVINALFGYRNKIFHHGFEWPIEERDSFKKRIQDEGWPDDWFRKSTTGNSPWIFYLSETFINKCFKTLYNVLDVFGECVQELMKVNRETDSQIIR